MATGVFLADFEQIIKVHSKGGADRHVRRLPLVAHSALIQADDGKTRQVELRGPGLGQALFMVRASTATLSAIAADPKIKRIPGDTLTKPLSELSLGERNAVSAQIERMGYNISEITARFPNFKNHTLLEVLAWAASNKPWLKPRMIDGVIGVGAKVQPVPNLVRVWEKFLQPKRRSIRPHKSGPYGTAVLDDFSSYSGGAQLGAQANWTSPLTGPGSPDMEVYADSPNAISATGADEGEAYYSAATYGPDGETHVKCEFQDGDIVSLFARIQSPGTTNNDGYVLEHWTGEGFNLYRIDDDSWTQLGSTNAQSIDTGDFFALACIGSTIEAWFDTGGGWMLKFDEVDSTYSAAGYTGIWVNWNTSRFIDFGAGTIVSDPAFTQASFRHRNDDGPLGEPL